MGIAVLVLFYGSGVFFVIASIILLIRYIKWPMHLHWELSKGGSVYELPEYWTKAHRRVATKLKSIALDILLLRGYYQRNRSFWYWLITFHSGLYLLIIWHIWLFAGSVTLSSEASPLWATVFGYAATGMIFLGSAGILASEFWIRSSEPTIRLFIMSSGRLLSSPWPADSTPSWFISMAI